MDSSFKTFKLPYPLAKFNQPGKKIANARTYQYCIILTRRPPACTRMMIKLIAPNYLNHAKIVLKNSNILHRCVLIIKIVRQNSNYCSNPIISIAVSVKLNFYFNLKVIYYPISMEINTRPFLPTACHFGKRWIVQRRMIRESFYKDA